MREGEPSATAQRVAAHRVTFERLSAPYGDPDADKRLSKDVARGVTVDAISSMAEYLAARTRFFDEVVVASISSGIEQIVVAGAGYDARSLRYAKPGVSWFELDHPATQADKLARLTSLTIDVGHVRFVAADFRDENLSGRLVDAGLSAVMPSLFICEGVAVYLDVEVLTSLLSSLARSGGPGSRLAISLSVDATSPEARQRRARFEAGVARLGEPVRSSLAAEDADGLLAQAGWRRAAPRGHDGGLERHLGLVVCDLLDAGAQGQR